MTEVLQFAEPASVQDLSRYIGRARRIQEQGIRVQGHGYVLAAWVPVMTPSSLVGRLPAVLGLRTMALSEESHADVTAEFAAFSERIARMGPADTALSLPVARLNAPWAAVTPPRAGWQHIGTIGDDELRTIADNGVEAVTTAVPDRAGAAVVEQVRESVWSAPLTASSLQAHTRSSETEASDSRGPQEGGTSESLEVPSGAAFGAQALGFLRPAGSQGQTEIHAQGRWVRLTSAGGHILCRRTVG